MADDSRAGPPDLSSREAASPCAPLQSLVDAFASDSLRRLLLSRCRGSSPSEVFTPSAEEGRAGEGEAASKALDVPSTSIAAPEASFSLLSKVLHSEGLAKGRSQSLKDCAGCRLVGFGVFSGVSVLAAANAIRAPAGTADRRCFALLSAACAFLGEEVAPSISPERLFKAAWIGLSHGVCVRDRMHLL